MKTNVKETKSGNPERAKKLWWLLLVVGIIIVGLGVFFSINTNATINTITILVLIFFVVSSAIGIFGAVKNHKTVSNWPVLLIVNIIPIIIGVIIILLPYDKTSSITYTILSCIGFLAIAATLVLTSLNEKKLTGGKGWLGSFMAGIIIALLAIAIMVFPSEGLHILAILSIIAIFVFGIMLIIRSVILKCSKPAETVK